MPTEPQSQPLVSIIVPVYNAADHIARCIESIRRQTYRNLEIILLNDGSKDVSYAVCQSYAGIDRRIVVIDKNNSGVSATRNLGMQEAHGKYFQFVDADDFIQPYATELLVPVFQGGKLVYEVPDIQTSRAYCQRQVDALWDEVKRFENPHNYYVDLSQKLWDIKYDLLTHHK